MFLSEMLREDKKVLESSEWQCLRDMAEFKIAAIIKMSQNEQGKFFVQNGWSSKMAEFKMAAIIKLSQNESDWISWSQKSK